MFLFKVSGVISVLATGSSSNLGALQELWNDARQMPLYPLEALLSARKPKEYMNGVWAHVAPVEAASWSAALPTSTVAVKNLSDACGAEGILGKSQKLVPTACIVELSVSHLLQRRWVGYFAAARYPPRSRGSCARTGRVLRWELCPHYSYCHLLENPET